MRYPVSVYDTGSRTGLPSVVIKGDHGFPTVILALSLHPVSKVRGRLLYITQK